MRVGIHQMNYIPWMGYFNKIAKSDAFILMDEVQLSDGAMSQRNRVLNKNGDISFLTVAFEKKGYMEIPFSEVKLTSVWIGKSANIISYGIITTSSPFGKRCITLFPFCLKKNSQRCSK